jgi:hypothetical protein
MYKLKKHGEVRVNLTGFAKPAEFCSKMEINQPCMASFVGKGGKKRRNEKSDEREESIAKSALHSPSQHRFFQTFARSRQNEKYF